jgi:NAD(P)-dependent dehydrogenase (short-subunit alcohol dehydrogenase family)
MILSEAKVVVTGGCSGLGRATVEGFVAEGAQVTAFDLQGDAPGGAGVQHVDVRDETAVAAALDAAIADMGGLTAVVNCAGIATGEKVVGRDGPHALDTFQQTIDINLVGSFNVARLAAARMAEQAPDAGGMRGVIVNTASIAAFEGQKGQAAYAASKAGIAGLSLPMARDLARQGIRVMAIAPGIFRTPMLESLGQEIMDGLAADVTFPQRLGDPAEFAALARFIVSCDYLNGTVIRIDGALRMP